MGGEDYRNTDLKVTFRNEPELAGLSEKGEFLGG